MIQPPTPRSIPRFLPTLTEVVHVSADSVQPVVATYDSEQLVRRVMQSFDGHLTAAFEEAIAKIAKEQMAGLEPMLKQMVELAVRKAVHESALTGSAETNLAVTDTAPLDPAK